MGKETECVHGGSYRDKVTRGVNTPIFTSSAYEYLDRPECPYPRYFNTPNQNAVVETETVVPPTAYLHRLFFQPSPTRGRLPRVNDPGFKSRNPINRPARQRRDS